MRERVRVEIEAGVADVRLARPEKLNALDGEMFEALVAAGERLAADRSLRAVVLSGEGRAFCAGIDLESLGGGGTARNLFERGAASPANFAQRAAWVWTEVPVPVIAAIHGVAFGGGLQIALAADLRFVAPDALALARLVRALRRGGGDISIAVDPARGSTFTVFLPIAAPPAARGRGQAAASRAAAPPPPA